MRTPGRRSHPPLTVEIEAPDGVRLAVHDWGGQGPDLLVVHANGFHARVFDPLVRHLPDHRVLGPDLRAHGASSPPVGDRFAWEGFGADVLATVDAFGLERPVAIGHSLGGAALLLAEQARPGTFAALYVFEPVVFPGPPAGGDGASPLAEGALRRRRRFPNRTAAVQNFAAKPPMSAFDPEVVAAYVDHGFVTTDDDELTLACRPEHEAAIYGMGTRHRAFERLHTVTCPVVVARGAVTGFGPGAVAGAVVDALPAGRLEVHDELGHFGPLEDPATVAAAALAAFPDP